ncbi:ATP-binding cassette domain-containing protein [Streptomyces wuyuanensis]|uniref:ATP-binding cassette domain-containing protein n=1 Tax=Streptomyces wuyuanensis TaxID=1196353 RepID=UPI001FCBBB62|nr:ABC transporter ATP-binding protein [Streptomyces wuyuanensis]
MLPQAVPFLARRRPALLRLGGWSLLETAQTFLGGYAVAAALDRGFLTGRPGVGLVWLAVAAAAVVAGGTATNRVFHHLADLVEPLRDGLVRKVVTSALSAAVAGRERHAGHAAVSRLTHQTEAARDGFAGLVMVTRSFVFTAAGVVVGLAALAPALLLIVLPPLAAGLVLFAAALRPMATRQRDFLRTDEELAARLGADVAGLRDIVACGAEARTSDAAGELIDAQTRAARALARWAAVRTLALGLAGQAPVVLLLAAAPWLLDGGVTAGELLGALTYLTQALLPALNTLMTGLGAAGTRLLVILDRLAGNGGPSAAGPATARGSCSATGSATRSRTGSATDSCTSPATASCTGSATASATASSAGAAPCTAKDSEAAGACPDRPRADPRPRPQGAFTAARRPSQPSTPPTESGEAAPSLELRSLSFAYGPGAMPVVDGLDLSVRPGEHMAVVGPSGIGKSTLFALIAGLLVPARGELLIGGRPVHRPDGDPYAVRRALIPQEAYVFGGTLRDNLLYMCPDGAPAAAVESAVRAVGLDRVAHALGGLDARIDPAALSQGERQLVALARVYLAPARLVLLDEATCHLDPAAEARAERAFADRPGTLLVIAHRLSSARRADRVLVLDGVAATAGRHEELLERSETYRDLVGHWRPGAG